MAGRKHVNPYRDRRIFKKTARVKSKNIPGHAQARGGDCL